MAEFRTVSTDDAWVIALFAVAIFALVMLNLWHYRECKKLTPEERKRERDEWRTPGDW